MPVKNISLNGNWQLRCPKANKHIDCGMTLDIDVPGDVHNSLHDAGVIPEPFWADNFKQCSWVSRCDWLIYREFTIGQELAGKKLELIFDGIDTYATVRLNGLVLGETSNMFLQYRFDVSEVIRLDGVNLLEIEIHSTRNTIEQRDVEGYFACFNVHRIFSRRAQCQFSWDWAPDLPSVGIWQDVQLRAVEPGVIENVFARGDAKGSASFDIEIDPETAQTLRDEKQQFTIEVKIRNEKHSFQKQIKCSGVKNFVDIKVDDADLWWPSGYGQAVLYDYDVRLKNGATVLDQKNGRMGFRTVELIQQSTGDDQRSFRFEINGRKIFCMGANWVPCDCFTGSVKEATYLRLIELAKEGNLNTLRVWGGGIYEKDIFYDLCDELGLLVWQDMMFACGDIPDDDHDFVDEVVKEFKYQVRRLRNHPCIFHWCGGNEKTGAFGALITRGDLITKYLAHGIVKDGIPQASYTPSSPFSDNDISNNGNSGDTHGGTYEEAFADDITKFRGYIDKKRAVFMSEFGLHGPPVIRSLKKFMPAENLWPLNDIWECHVQDNPYNSIPETFVQLQRAAAERLFYRPESISDFVKTAGTFYAEYLYAEFQHHRRRQPENAGALIWMLNDCWPAANWSLVDYYGQPKQAYYALKRACRPVMFSFREMDGGFELYLTNNSQADIAGNVRVYLRNIEGTIKQIVKQAEVAVGSQDSNVALEFSRVSSVLEAPNGYLTAEFEGLERATREIYFHNLWKDIDWQEPDVKIEMLSETTSDRYEMVCRVSAQRFARCVNLAATENVEVLFSDNYFDIPAGEYVDVVIKSNKQLRVEELILNHWLTDWNY